MRIFFFLVATWQQISLSLVFYYVGERNEEPFFWGYTVNTLQIEQLFGK